MEKILLVVRNPIEGKNFEHCLVSKHCEVTSVFSGEAALKLVEQNWDLIILHHPLPEVSTGTVLEFIKQQPIYPPVFIVSRSTDFETKLSFFKAGCDDYMSFPLNSQEFAMRSNALLRRRGRVSDQELIYEDLVLDSRRMILKCGNKTVSLTPKESGICRIFMSHPERVITKRNLFQAVWGLKEEPETRPLEVQMFYLRKKITSIGKKDWFHRIPKVGFVLSRPGMASLKPPCQICESDPQSAPLSRSFAAMS